MVNSQLERIVVTVTAMWAILRDTLSEDDFQTLGEDFFSILLKSEDELDDFEKAPAILDLFGRYPDVRDIFYNQFEDLRGTEQEAMAKSLSNDFVVLPVYFATDRERNQRYELAEQFTGDWRSGGGLQYGVSEISIPNDHKVGQQERPKRWRWEQENPAKHISVLTLDVLDAQAFKVQTLEDLSKADSGDVLIFIHGYRTTFASALRTTAQLTYDLQFDGIPICYSWPSRGTFSGYAKDETNSNRSKAHFEMFMEYVQTELNPTKIHLIGHSMGNRILSDWLAKIPAPQKELQQIVFAAPDVDSEVFKQRAKHFLNKFNLGTLYAHAGDVALNISRFVHGNWRAGDADVPLLMEGVETVHVTDIDNSIIRHSYVVSNRLVVQDLELLIKQGASADDRPGLLEKQHDQKRYWAFAP